MTEGRIKAIGFGINALAEQHCVDKGPKWGLLLMKLAKLPWVEHVADYYLEEICVRVCPQLPTEEVCNERWVTPGSRRIMDDDIIVNENGDNDNGNSHYTTYRMISKQYQKP
ncbi:hypothetical protein E0Z10_g2323 [Xylaria hypoxylon]|uniref:Uncharacterized protein n=1 Tax=Xylaria hypoxylon TaxID=37992 RepID=A0A4Z0ZCT5_9PEZI|nr:hypothetical protein E0Z10_g2323 [Xylaria hypoxylon]